ncbi:MAG: hypothetical protein ABI456_00595 [Ktedonobacteraceae bacterium]
MEERFGSDPWPTPSQKFSHSFQPSALHASSPALPPRNSQRTWPALLTLYLLAPLIGEVLSGSTPPLMFLHNPFNLFYLPALYGSGAILVRELVRRRGLGWGSVLLLGAAYGILEEGLVVTSWFNPYWPDLGLLASYGRLLDTSWVWAVGLTIYHAVVSITLPIVLTEALFPSIAVQPWLGKRRLRVVTAWLTVTSLLGLLGFGFLAFRKQGYSHPPLMYLGAVFLAMAFVWWGLHLSPKMLAVATSSAVPGPWRLRVGAFAATCAFFFLLWVLPYLIAFPIVLVAAMGALVVLASRWVARWSRRAGWGTSQRVALTSGVLCFFILLSPLIEFGAISGRKITTGQTLFGLIFLLAFVWLTWQVKRQPAVHGGAK